MKIRFSLVESIFQTKVRVVIGPSAFLWRPIVKRAFYKLLRAQEVYSL